MAERKAPTNFLWENLDRSAISNHGVYLLNLPIADGDAACSPVSDIERLYSASRTAVDKDIASGRATLLGCKGSVCIVWIGNTNGQMIETFRVSPVDEVASLGRLSIPFELLVPFGCKAKTDWICFQRSFLAIEEEHPLGLVKPQTSNRRPAVSPKFSGTSRQQTSRQCPTRKRVVCR